VQVRPPLTHPHTLSLHPIFPNAAAPSPTHTGMRRTPSWLPLLAATASGCHWSGHAWSHSGDTSTWQQCRGALTRVMHVCWAKGGGRGGG
jgi:hypothetical protein